MDQFPQAPDNTVRAVSNFFRNFAEKIRGDIRSSRCTAGVLDTGGKWEKSPIRKIFSSPFGHLWVVELENRTKFFFKFISSCQQFDNCSLCLPPVLLTPVANLLPVSTTLAKLMGEFAARVVYTNGKFATGVVDTGGAALLANFFRKFRKSRDTVPLSWSIFVAAKIKIQVKGTVRRD
jgi:hypothetical protein